MILLTAILSFLVGCITIFLLLLVLGRKAAGKKKTAFENLMSKPYVTGPNSIIDAGENIVVKLN